MSTVLAKLSLLRTSDTSDAGHRSYHFLHLTFQEYFAAQYYVEHWKSGKPLPYLKIRNRKARLESILPESLLQQEKYNARYDVLWRFVAGMLQGQDEDHLRRFFALIEDTPHDLLGPVHQRLTMHCLSEVASSNEALMSIALREKLETQLSRWALFEHESNGTASLAGDMQFPERVLETILQGGSMVHRSSLMRSLPARCTSMPRFIKFMTTWLREGVSPNMMTIICKTLNKSPHHLPDETLNALARRLADQHYSIRCSALSILGKQRNLPEETLEDVAKKLEDTDSRVREAAAYALRDRLDDDEEYLNAVMVRLASLEDPYFEKLLQRMGDIQSTSPEESLEASSSEDPVEETLPTELWGAESNATSQIKSSEVTLPRELYKAAAEIPLLQEYLEAYLSKELLGYLAKTPLSEDILAAVAKRLDDRSSEVRKAAANALGAHSILPEEILEKVVERLDDKRTKVREAAAHTLGGQSVLPGKILEAVAKRLDDKNSDVRACIVYALGGQYNLPKEILKAVAKRLDDTESNVRQAVAHIFGFQPNFLRVNLLFLYTRSFRIGGDECKSEFFSILPDDLFTRGVAKSSDENSQVKEAVTRAWTYHSTLPIDILTAMAKGLNDKDSQVREATTRALARQSNLPGEIVTTVAALLKDADIGVRDAATRVLKQQSVLLEEIGQALAVAMNDQKDQEDTDQSSGIEDEISSSPAAEDEISLSSAAEDEVAEGLINLINLGKHGSEDRSPVLQFKNWLKQSYRAQMVLYIKDGNLCFQNAERLWSTPFKSRKEKRHFMTMIQEIRTDLGVPQLGYDTK